MYSRSNYTLIRIGIQRNPAGRKRATDIPIIVLKLESGEKVM